MQYKAGTLLISNVLRKKMCIIINQCQDQDLFLYASSIQLGSTSVLHTTFFSSDERASGVQKQLIVNNYFFFLMPRSILVQTQFHAFWVYFRPSSHSHTFATSALYHSNRYPPHTFHMGYSSMMQNLGQLSSNVNRNFPKFYQIKASILRTFNKILLSFVINAVIKTKKIMSAGGH